MQPYWINRYYIYKLCVCGIVILNSQSFQYINECYCVHFISLADVIGFLKAFGNLDEQKREYSSSKRLNLVIADQE